MKIASKISLSFLVTAVVVTGAAAPVFYITARKSLEDRIYAHLETTAQSRAHHIEAYLIEHKERVRIMADSAVVETALKAFKNKESYSTEELTKEASLEVTEFIQTDGDVYEIFVLNTEGKIVISTEEGNVGLDRSTDAYFLGARERVYIKDAYYSTTAKRRSGSPSPAAAPMSATGSTSPTPARGSAMIFCSTPHSALVTTSACRRSKSIMAKPGRR